MSTEGVVKNWNRGYGFAEASTGEVVWIHKGQLPDEHKLKPGEAVFFDMEPVEGHGGRVKGVNVSGPGVVAAGEKLSKEEVLQEKKEWADFKKEKLGPMSDAPPRAKKAMRKPGTQPGARVAGGGGGAGVAGDEKRIDPADGNAYTKQDFVACYSGLKEWNAAKPVAQPKGRGRGAAAAAPYNAGAKRGRGGGIVSRPNGAGSGKPLGKPAGGGGRKGGKGGKGGGGRGGGRGGRK
ncbi:hypothetical protein DIPPA_14988 [Diplonema papillatum]|nr:hypothetical protein DIPPA_14988 [Diplonema papillatum]